eukprot:s491_g30.t1
MLLDALLCLIFWAAYLGSIGSTIPPAPCPFCFGSASAAGPAMLPYRGRPFLVFCCFAPAYAFSAWGDGGTASMVLSAISWLSENADPQQPKMSESYLRSNAYYAVKARETIPVAKEIPEGDGTSGAD